MATSWEYRYAQRMKGMQSSAVREILKITSQPDVISFAGGMPAPELFPLKEVEAVSNGFSQPIPDGLSLQHGSGFCLPT